MKENLLSIHELNDELQEELEKLADEYVNIMHKIGLFAENNNIWLDEVIEYVEESYEEDLTYGDTL